MADTTPPSQPPQDDMHWGISYLREDIQDLKQEIRALQQRLDARIDGVSADVVALGDKLGHRIDSQGEATNQRIDTKFGQLLAVIVAASGIIVGAMFTMFQMFRPVG